jgi:hypothetical protein
VSNEHHREVARREHRAIILFAVIQCWTRNLDGVYITRNHLERLLRLDRFKRKRVEWLVEDALGFFPFSDIAWKTNQFDPDGKLNSLETIFLSRVSLSDLPGGIMSNDDRVSALPNNGPKMAGFEMWPYSEDCDDLYRFEGQCKFYADRSNVEMRLITSFLAALSQGRVSPTNLQID